MSDHIASLPFWEGFSVTSSIQSGQSVSIRLEPCPSAARICRHCASVAPKVHDVSWRTVRDLPVVGHALTLEVAVYRVKCEGCGRTGSRRVSWLDPHARVTRRLAAFVAL